MCVLLYVSMHAFMHVCVCECMYEYMCVYMYECMYEYVCVNVCMYV